MPNGSRKPHILLLAAAATATVWLAAGCATGPRWEGERVGQLEKRTYSDPEERFSLTVPDDAVRLTTGYSPDRRFGRISSFRSTPGDFDKVEVSEADTVAQRASLRDPKLLQGLPEQELAMQQRSGVASELLIREETPDGLFAAFAIHRPDQLESPPFYRGVLFLVKGNALYFLSSQFPGQKDESAETAIAELKRRTDALLGNIRFRSAPVSVFNQ